MLRKIEGNFSPLVTVSVVSHGNSKDAFRLLASMREFENANLLQLIVTDNLGNEFPEIDGGPWLSLILLRNEHPKGYASNHNHAFQLAKGKYFCIVNPDVLFQQEIFLPLINLLENGQADIVTPLIVDAGNVHQDSFRAFPTPFELIWRRLPGYRFSPPPIDDVGLAKPDWVAGMFMLMKSDSYRKINGFDENYRLYFEDVDFCARARVAGLKIVVDTNHRVRHDAQRASRRKPIYLFWHIQSAIRFFTSPVYKKALQNLK